MSPDRPRDSRYRGNIGILAALLGVMAAILWMLPIRYVQDLRVEAVRLLAPGEQDGSIRAAPLATPRRIVVTFSTPVDLASVRRASGLGFLAARLADCADGGGTAEEVVDQRAEYRPDDGRVRTLPVREGRYRYRVVFDDRLTRLADHQFRNTPAIGTAGGLCFSLRGGAMWFGYLRSATIRLARPV